MVRRTIVAAVLLMSVASYTAIAGSLRRLMITSPLAMRCRAAQRLTR